MYMELWVRFAIIAAVFITVRDYMSLSIIKKYSYINYIIYANIFVFIGTMMYVYFTGTKIMKPTNKEMLIILMRLFIIYLIIEPAIFYAMKYCKNPGYAKSIINLNTLFIFIVAIFFLKEKLTFKGVLGILSILMGSYLIS
jgi:drug/metabolite transporter (DMT)-like permease